LLNISTGQYYSAPNSFAGSYADTVFNLPSGTYVITAEYSATPGFANSNHCASTTDTIVIPPYQNPVLSAFSLIPCGSAFYLHCLADSSTGVLPYTYEVVSGPATFPAQSSNTFLLTNIGTYDIRLFDACGNSAVKAITIDSLPRGPEFIVRNIDSCYRAVVKGHVYTENSTLTDTITNAMGCDSIITVDSIFIQGNKNTHIFPTAADTFCSIHHNEIAADNVYAHYLWSDGSTASTLAVDQSGMYALTVTDDAGCASSDTIAVIVIDSAYIIDGWINDASACDLSPLHISLTLSTSDANYTWDATDAAPNDLQRTITDSGRYYFSVSNYCGTIVYELTVSEKACTENVYIPTAFTPNGDGTNDLFQVFTSYEAKVFDLKIFNRWGEKVYDTNNISKGWDGTYMGEIQPAGVYVYVADIVSLHNDTIHKEGSLSLIR
jgi:gliding motility-associated-like protein